jgi:hypothetical protein
VRREEARQLDNTASPPGPECASILIKIFVIQKLEYVMQIEKDHFCNSTIIRHPDFLADLGKRQVL